MINGQSYTRDHHFADIQKLIVSLLYVNCSYVVARNNGKINNQFTCESHTYKCTIHNID